MRLHDNESLRISTEDKSCKLLPLFIFDGETPTTKYCKYNKISFLLECLEDLDTQLFYCGGKVNLVEGDPVEVIETLSKQFNIQQLCFDQNSEPIWLDRDNAVKNFCGTHRIKVSECIEQSLWDPLEIIDANGGTPPLTWRQFCYVIKTVGPPRRPLPDVDLRHVEFIELDSYPHMLAALTIFPHIPTPEMLGISRESGEEKIYNGGERVALKYLNRRIKVEKESFTREPLLLPNKVEPGYLNAPKSLSPDFKFGCISVRKFYWDIMDAWMEFNENDPQGPEALSQLIWREFFYAMSANNPFYGEMERNPICINVPWFDNEEHLTAYLSGTTGFPFIDAGIRQLKKEGWTHHIVSYALRMFLTRGDLWLSWEHGLKFFLNYMIDSDWAVCAGNWMWVSSSAFEKSLNNNLSLDPSVLACRLDPCGEYIKKYVPELARMPVEFIYEPWRAGESVQREASCVIGVDYPAPIVNHGEVSKRNRDMMEELQETLMKKCNKDHLKHIKPSDEAEIEFVFGLSGHNLDM